VKHSALLEGPIARTLEAYGYRSHEFGDSMLVEKRAAVGRRFTA
jgi:hypothetical protein